MIEVIGGKLWQWDTGRTVKMTPKQGASIYEVHFDNGTTDNALVGVVKIENNEITSEIPNIFLQTSNIITVYSVCVDESGERTEESLTVSVNSRPKPDDYVYTETEVKTWDRLEAEIHGAIDAIADAEQQRVENESQRQAAETNRAETFARDIQAATEATERAKTAATEAENASDLANAASVKANNAADTMNTTFSNALKGAASGEQITVDDVSPIEHSVDVKISRINLIPFPYSYSTQEINGVNFTVNDNGTITVSGTATANTIFQLYRQNAVIPKGFEKGKIYTLSGVNDVANLALNANYVYQGSSHRAWLKSGNLTDVFPDDAVGLYIYMRVDNGKTVNGTIAPQIEMGDVATEYKKYVGDLSKVTLSRYGSDENDNFESYAPDEDGNVYGVLSLSPIMTLKTDADGVNLSVIYNRDIEILNQQQKALKAEIDVAYNEIEQIGSRTAESVDLSVPDYWLEAISQKAEEITTAVRTALSAGHDIAAFIVQTDSHTPSNPAVSMKLMHYLEEKCGVSLLLHLGDIIHDTNIHETNIERINRALKYLKNSATRFLVTQGNHDTGNQNTQDGKLSKDRYVFESEWKAHAASKMLKNNSIVFDDRGKAFYYDDPLQKIRVISIDAFENNRYKEDGSFSLGGVTDNQIAWVKDVALATVPSGFSVVSFSHYSLFGALLKDNSTRLDRGVLSNADKLIAAFNEFKNSGGVYIGHFSGHLHLDFLCTTNGITNIWLLNDGNDEKSGSDFGEAYDGLIDDAPTKTRGTTTECAFDVAIINKTTRQGSLIRIGAGNNRQWTY